MNNQQTLVILALKLTTLGYSLERQRSKVRKLVETGLSLSSDEVLEAVRKFERISAEWSALEAEYLALWDELNIRRGVTL